MPSPKISIEIIKQGVGNPVSNRDRKGTVWIDYQIGRSGNEIFLRILGMRRMGSSKPGGNTSKKWYSFSHMASQIKAWPETEAGGQPATYLASLLSGNSPVRGWIVSALRKEKLLIECKHLLTNPKFGLRTGFCSKRNPAYSLDAFLAEMRKRKRKHQCFESVSPRSVWPPKIFSALETTE